MKIFSKCVVAIALAGGMAVGAWAQERATGGSALTVGTGTNETHVVAKRADYDISKNILVLDGDVMVKDPRVTITADQIIMVMNTNREPENVRAIGHVVIEQDLNPTNSVVPVPGKKGMAMKGFRRATCGQAIYEIKSGITVLLEKPVITQEGMTLNGSRIIYSRDQDKVHIDNSSGIFIPGEGQTGVKDIMTPKKSATPKAKE